QAHRLWRESTLAFALGATTQFLASSRRAKYQSPYPHSCEAKTHAVRLSLEPSTPHHRASKRQPSSTAAHPAPLPFCRHYAGRTLNPAAKIPSPAIRSPHPAPSNFPPTHKSPSAPQLAPP